MRRRNFILSALAVAAGSFVKIRSAVGASLDSDHGELTFLKDSPVPVRNAGIYEEDPDGTLILKNAANELIGLNDSGGLIWGHINGQRSCDEIAALVSGEYKIALDEASRDVSRFVSDLTKGGFVKIARISRRYEVKEAILIKRLA